MSAIGQNIHENNGIDHNFNMVLSILNIKNIYNTNFSPGYSLVCSNISKEYFLCEKSSSFVKKRHFHLKNILFLKNKLYSRNSALHFLQLL